MNNYAILNIPINSDIKIVKKAYKKLALLYHPDKNKDPDAAEKFNIITKAYNEILEPKKPSTLIVNLELTLEELYSGGTHRVFYNDTYSDVYVYAYYNPDNGPIILENELYGLGTLIVNIIQIKHHLYTRIDDDLHMTMNITIKEALVGFERTFLSIKNEIIHLVHTDIINPHTVLTYSLGFKDKLLYINFNIIFPDKLDNIMRQQLNLINF